MNRDARVICLHATAADIACAELCSHCVQHCVVLRNGAARDQGLCFLKSLPDRFAARHLARTRVTGAVLEQNQVARKKRPVRPAQVQQHAVAAGNGNDAHLCHNWSHI